MNTVTCPLLVNRVARKILMSTVISSSIAVIYLFIYLTLLTGVVVEGGRHVVGGIFAGGVTDE